MMDSIAACIKLNQIVRKPNITLRNFNEAKTAVLNGFFSSAFKILRQGFISKKMQTTIKLIASHPTYKNDSQVISETLLKLAKCFKSSASTVLSLCEQIEFIMQTKEIDLLEFLNKVTNFQGNISALLVDYKSPYLKKKPSQSLFMILSTVDDAKPVMVMLEKFHGVARTAAIHTFACISAEAFLMNLENSKIKVDLEKISYLVETQMKDPQLSLLLASNIYTILKNVEPKYADTIHEVIETLVLYADEGKNEMVLGYAKQFAYASEQSSYRFKSIVGQAWQIANAMRMQILREKNFLKLLIAEAQ